MAIEKIPYLQGGRALCVTGCCFLTAANGVLGRAIRLCEGENAYVSHAACVVRLPAEMMDEDRVSLIEALEHGLTPTYASERFQGFDGHVYLFTPAGLTDEKQHKFRYWLIDKMFRQTPYDYSSLFKNAVCHVDEESSMLFCSEAWGMAATYSGIERIDAFKGPKAPQPPDIVTWWPGRVVEVTGPFM